MNRKGRVNYTPQEEAERKNYILQRLRSGFSRLETQKQFSQEFDCSIDTARNWYNKTTAELISPDLQERRKTHAVIVEMYHAQVTAAQADLVSIQQELITIENTIKKRNDLTETIIKGDEENADSARKHLNLLPEVRIDSKLNGLEIKSRARERIFRMISELARLQGVYNTDNNWMQALHTLLDNGLLPPSNAEHILGIIEELTKQIQSTTYTNVADSTESINNLDDLN